MNDTKIASKTKAQLANFMDKAFAHFSKPSRKFIEECIYGIQTTGGKGIAVYDRGGDRPAFYDYFMEEGRDFIVRLKGRSVLSWGGMHEVHDLARQCTTPRRSSSCRASPNSSTSTTDSRFGRETPKTTSRNALQPLSMRVRRFSALKEWVDSRDG